MTDNIAPPPVPKEDNLVEELMVIVNPLPLTPELRNEVMQQLVMYIVDRDHKILTHGYQAGRAIA